MKALGPDTFAPRLLKEPALALTVTEPLAQLLGQIDGLQTPEDEGALILGVAGCTPGEGTSLIVHSVAGQLAHKAGATVLRLALAELIRCRPFPASELLAACSRCDDSPAWCFAPPERALLADAAQTASAQQVEQMLTGLAGHFRYVILDCGALDTSAAFWSVARTLDHTFLVVAAGTTSRSSILAARSVIQRSGAPFAGSILTRHTDPLPQWLRKRIA